MRWPARELSQSIVLDSKREAESRHSIEKSCIEFPSDRSAEYGVTVKVAPILPRKDILESLVALMTQGKMRVFIEHRLPVADFQRAQELSQSGHVRGKIVLQLRKPDGSPIG